MALGGYAASSKLSSKSGNYMGKLRFSAGEYSLYKAGGNVVRSIGTGEEYALHAGMYFNKAKTTSKKGGPLPRCLSVLLPAGKTLSTGFSELEMGVADTLRSGQALRDEHVVLVNKPPQFENGCYRLHFNGRVREASVKNFQMIRREEAGTTRSRSLSYYDEITLQFGKVGKDRFHCDFRAPLSPFQAFATALAQFTY